MVRLSAKSKGLSQGKLSWMSEPLFPKDKQITMDIYTVLLLLFSAPDYIKTFPFMMLIQNDLISFHEF